MAKTDTQWHLVVDEIASAIGFTGSGAALYKALESHHARPGNPIVLIFECGACASSMYFNARKFQAAHLERRSQGPTLTCECGRSSGHTFLGMQ